MTWLARYAAAVLHLGPRQAWRHLVHRVRRSTRSYRRYARVGPSALEFTGRAAVPFLSHSAGTALAGGRFSALNRSRPVGDPPDWEPSEPLLWVFNLHYFGHLNALPREQQVRLVLDWIDRYPPGPTKPGWMPYPLSLRLRNWTKLLFDAFERPAAILASIEAQGDCLSDTVELHLRGNHLLENALTLTFLGACFEGRAARRWRRLGEAILGRELPEQFLPDGGHFERSPMYHALLTHAMLDLLNVLDERDSVRHRLAARMPGILAFLSAMRHPDGAIALFNDSAFGTAPEPEDLLAYASRLGLRLPGDETGAFPDTGYYVWRHGSDALVMDVGPIGPDYVPAHAHADMLSFEMSLGGKRVVVDGGTSTYEEGDERKWARSTRAHNTVEIAGADQCDMFGAFRVGRRGRPRDVQARLSGGGLHVEAWHDGYRRLPGRPIHRRELMFLASGVLLVWDTVESRVAHPVLSRLRFAPGAVVGLRGPREARVELGGLELVVRAFGSEIARETGYYAPSFGERIPCEVLVLSKGPEPGFGFALAKHEVAIEIDADGASVQGRRVARGVQAAV